MTYPNHLSVNFNINFGYFAYTKILQGQSTTKIYRFGIYLNFSVIHLEHLSILFPADIPENLSVCYLLQNKISLPC